MKCSVPQCKTTKHVQYLMVRRYTKPQVPQEEFYCQPHLRERVMQLELTRLAGLYANLVGRQPDGPVAKLNRAKWRQAYGPRN